MRCQLLALLIVALSGCTTVQIKESQLIRPDPPGTAAPAPPEPSALLPGARVRAAHIVTDDGAQLRGVIAERPGARVTVLYFGGNAFHLDRDGAQLLPLLAACGNNVAVFDYRGYGRSSGVPTVATMTADAVRIFDHVSARAPGPVIVHGLSLGSFMAAQVVRARPQTAGLVLEATSTNVVDWAHANVPWYARPFVRLDIGASLRAVDNLAAVSGYRGASLVLAGTRDGITPPALGQRVYAALPAGQKQWVVADGAGHNDIFGRPDVMAAYCALVKRISTLTHTK
ncbi:alpha/beta hydrolase [Massilia sp. DWR3-1-1]|uniref:alpha/beta hydrolase n=1 Tax=Massilia sp. DWR3-1-1 TaxID=2804559 RepID=UPI003CEF361C